VKSFHDEYQEPLGLSAALAEPPGLDGGGAEQPSAGAPLGWARWTAGARGPVGLWVHHAPGQDEGTLEDLAGPVFGAQPEWAPLMQAAGAFVEAQAPEEAPVRAKRDKAWKAAITIAGQLRRDAERKSPLAGSGMNVMIQRGLEPAAFDAEVCRALTGFLLDVPWDGPPAPRPTPIS